MYQSVPNNTSGNTYNYDNQVLSGPGTVENLVRRNMIADPEGIHQPRTGGNFTPENLAPKATEGYNKAEAPVYEVQTDKGRQYLTYGGIWIVEFFKENTVDKVQFLANLDYEGTVTYTEDTDPTIYRIRYDAASSQAERTKRNLDITTLRTKYNEAEDIGPEFTKLPRKVESSLPPYFIRYPLDKFEEDERQINDLKYFSNDPSNYARVYFGGRLTGTDIGFYYDNSDNIRASYDPHYLFKASPLLDDLLKYGTPEQYVVGRYPSGMVQFVINKDLAKVLLDAYITEDNLAARWNDAKIKYTPNFNMGNYPTFEETLDVESGKYISSDSIFEFTTEQEKKPQTNG